ncbi:hypothetical protein WICMUC_003320 [Wickerhamomyces mucosus]|uniref:Dienelactone hydrolase domain-containing protein n=1 Tax=Wickerhamomyces mucosus TaxID=1378264 RepID=A0A9P8PMA3_9ASCO|nr:hypothetical protein WICMUC_003320 [Wickerhamomyces mucosus]
MASKAPGQCCSQIDAIHEGTAKGTIVELYGNQSVYITGSKQSEKVIVIATDIFGIELINTQLLADAFASKGYYVLIPDILKGDPAVAGKTDLPKWIVNHSAEITAPIFDSFIENLHKELSPKFLGIIGYCFGAKYTVQHLAEGRYATAGAIAHPSFVSIEEVAAITKPIIISAAGVDTIFTHELRHATEDKLIEIGAEFQLDLFASKGKVTHGYAVRGDISIPEVKYAKEKTFADQVAYFERFSN